MSRKELESKYHEVNGRIATLSSQILADEQDVLAKEKELNQWQSILQDGAHGKGDGKEEQKDKPEASTEKKDGWWTRMLNWFRRLWGRGQAAGDGGVPVDPGVQAPPPVFSGERGEDQAEKIREVESQARPPAPEKQKEEMSQSLELLRAEINRIKVQVETNKRLILELQSQLSDVAKHVSEQHGVEIYTLNGEGFKLAGQQYYLTFEEARREADRINAQGGKVAIEGVTLGQAKAEDQALYVMIDRGTNTPVMGQDGKIRTFTKAQVDEFALGEGGKNADQFAVERKDEWDLAHEENRGEGEEEGGMKV